MSMAFIVILLVLLNTVLVFSFFMPARSSSPQNLFSAYADLLTEGQTIAAVRNRRLPCHEVLSQQHLVCSLQPTDGVFSGLFVTITGDQSEGVSFQALENRLFVGDLVLLWGKPHVNLRGSMSWSERDGTWIIALIARSDRLDYLAPVRVVTYTFLD
jgi:hypothetical protein